MCTLNLRYCAHEDEDEDCERYAKEKKKGGRTIPLYGWLVHGSRVVHMGIVDGSRRAIGGHGGACGALSELR